MARQSQRPPAAPADVATAEGRQMVRTDQDILAPSWDLADEAAADQATARWGSRGIALVIDGVRVVARLGVDGLDPLGAGRSWRAARRSGSAGRSEPDRSSLPSAEKAVLRTYPSLRGAVGREVGERACFVAN